MERIVHTLFLHFSHKKAHRTHHYHRVGSLDGNNNIVENRAFLKITQKLHTALYNAFGRIAITRHNTVGKAAVVFLHLCALPYDFLFFAYLNKRREAVFYFF